MLEIKNLSKSFGKLKAVDDVSFAVGRGETVVLMGPSGCGKSTTIRSINRLIEPDSGSIIIGGTDITALAPDELRLARRRIGFVFQQFNLVSRLTAVENVMLGLVMDGCPREEAYGKAVDALAKVGLEDHKDFRPDQLSGGQQQRVGIARALALEPDLMLWDEPTASLDPIMVREVLVVMEELARRRDVTMLVVTHEQAFALHVADRIILMDKGRVVEEGSPHLVFGAPRSEVGRRYKELIEYNLQTGSRALAGKRPA